MRAERAGARLRAVVGLVCLIGCASCVPTTRSNAVADYDANPLTVSLPSKITAAQTEEAMVRTFIGRNWQVQQRSPRQVIATLRHRDCDGRATLKVEGAIIRIYNHTTCNGKPALHRNWLEYLQKDLNKHIQRVTLN